MQDAAAKRNSEELDPRTFVRLSFGLVAAMALAWTALYASFPAPHAVDEMAFENTAAARPLSD